MSQQNRLSKYLNIKGIGLSFTHRLTYICFPFTNTTEPLTLSWLLATHIHD